VNELLVWFAIPTVPSLDLLGINVVAGLSGDLALICGMDGLPIWFFVYWHMEL
jgi:hypothetical protein